VSVTRSPWRGESAAVSRERRARVPSALFVERIVKEAGGAQAAKVLFRGKIVDVERKLFKEHSYGEIIIQQTSDSDSEDPLNSLRSEAVSIGGQLKIPFKNENIYAQHIGEDGAEAYIAMVPDLIHVLDTQSGRALGVPEYKYGLLVTVLGIACSPRWTDTERGLTWVGQLRLGVILSIGRWECT
jgi:DUF917 family protein